MKRKREVNYEQAMNAMFGEPQPVRNYLLENIELMQPAKTRQPITDELTLEKSAFKACLIKSGQWESREHALDLFEAIRPMFDDSVTFRTYCAWAGFYGVGASEQTARDYLT